MYVVIVVVLVSEVVLSVVIVVIFVVIVPDVVLVIDVVGVVVDVVVAVVVVVVVAVVVVLPTPQALSQSSCKAHDINTVDRPVLILTLCLTMYYGLVKERGTCVSYM